MAVVNGVLRAGNKSRSLPPDFNDIFVNILVFHAVKMESLI